MNSNNITETREEIKTQIRTALEENDTRKVDYFRIFSNLTETHYLQRMLKSVNSQLNRNELNLLINFNNGKIDYLLSEMTKFDVVYN